ncbi:MAG: extracellular solute-binding protein [Albidovulum sp.]|nr:extracellular solute-binding protein [Albidovulum sp.]
MKQKNHFLVGDAQTSISRRKVLKSASAFAGAGLLASSASRAWAATFEEVGPQWASADIDWMSQAGKTIVLNAVQHPWTDAITPLIPHFTELTGINVDVQTQSETEYTAELPVKLGTGNPTPDVYMVWAIGQAITAGWLEPLDGFYANSQLSDASWWNDDDLFPSARSFQKWSDGIRYLMPITAESQILFINQPLLEEKGLSVPTTMDGLMDTAVALHGDDVAGIAMRAKSTGDSTWPAGGFIFSFGGAIIDLDGNVAINSPEAVAAMDAYGGLLHKAGPVGISSYQWVECLNDYMAGAVAMGCDSSNFATDIANPDKSVVAGKTVYATLPKAGDMPIKPNMWHWNAGINSSSANKDAAWLFLQWAESMPTCLLSSAAGLATPRASAWASDGFQNRFGAQAADTALSSLKAGDGDLFKATWFHPKGPQILDAFGIALNQIATGASDAKSAMDAAAAKIEADLAG